MKFPVFKDNHKNYYSVLQVQRVSFEEKETINHHWEKKERFKSFVLSFIHFSLFFMYHRGEN